MKPNDKAIEAALLAERKMSDILKWLQDKANEEWEYEDGDYFLEAIKQFTRLRAELTAVTAERDRLREVLRPFAVWCEAVEKYSFLKDDAYVCAYDVRLSDLRRARAALEGVTGKAGAENE